jgi:hypothetical protein
MPNTCNEDMTDSMNFIRESTKLERRSKTLEEHQIGILKKRNGALSQIKEPNLTPRLWYSFDVGTVHVIALCSDCDTSPTSYQFNWLKNDLETNVNRQTTPFVIIMIHVPLYHTNYLHAHQRRRYIRDFEHLFVKHGIDYVFAGHVHAYQRTYPLKYGIRTTTTQGRTSEMRESSPDIESGLESESKIDDGNSNRLSLNNIDRGAIHITVGTGGNYEGLTNRWYEDVDWSAYKNGEQYGYGILRANQTHAEWKWYTTEKASWGAQRTAAGKVRGVKNAILMDSVVISSRYPIETNGNAPSEKMGAEQAQ